MRKKRLKYSWPFILMLFTIFALVYINARIINTGASGNSDFASIINMAGKQRMLSQRLLTHYTLKQAGQAGYRDFSSLLTHWNRSHYMLTDGIQFTDDASLSSRELKSMASRLDPLYNPLYSAFADTAATLSAQRLTALIQMQNAYLNTMDSLVNKLETRANQNFMLIRDKQIVVAAVSGIVLFLETLLFLIPHFRNLLKAYAMQRKHQREIGNKQSEISRQNEELYNQNQELMQLKERLSLTLSGINAGVWSWNIATGEQEWSPKFYQLLGYQPGEITPNRQTFYNLLFVGVQQDVQHAVQAHLETGAPYKLNVRIRLKNGTLDWFELSGEAARDTDGKPVSMSGSIIYIGERVAYQQQLEEARGQYSQKLVNLGHLVKVAVKELTTTLHRRSRDLSCEDALPVMQAEVRKELEKLEKKVNEIAV